MATSKYQRIVSGSLEISRMKHVTSRMRYKRDPVEEGHNLIKTFVDVFGCSVYVLMMI